MDWKHLFSLSSVWFWSRESFMEFHQWHAERKMKSSSCLSWLLYPNSDCTGNFSWQLPARGNCNRQIKILTLERCWDWLSWFLAAVLCRSCTVGLRHPDKHVCVFPHFSVFPPFRSPSPPSWEFPQDNLWVTSVLLGFCAPYKDNRMSQSWTVTSFYILSSVS